MNWIRFESKSKIEILPVGEEDFHTPTIRCHCLPILSKDDRQKLKIIHNAFDGRDVFEAYAESPLHRVRPRRAV